MKPPARAAHDATGAPITEGQVNLTLRDFTRWAYPMINGGKGFGGSQVVPAAWVEEAFTGSSQRAAAFARGKYGEEMPGAEYRNQTWVLEPERVVAMLGIHGQFAYLDRANDLMVVGLSSFPDQANALLAATIQQLWTQVSQLTR